MCFCGIATAMIGFIVYYAITGDWSGYSLLDNLPPYCMLAVYFLEFRKYRKTGNASSILIIAQLCCLIITAYNIPIALISRSASYEEKYYSLLLCALTC